MNPAFPTPAAADQFRTSPALYLHSWGDEFVAYHALSGDTYLLDAPTGRLLQTLQQSPNDTLKRTSDALGERLTQLKALALIERTPP